MAESLKAFHRSELSVETNPRVMKYVWIYLILFGITVLAAWGVYSWIPEYRRYLRKEDSLVENLSALLFFSTFVLSLLFFIKSTKRQKALIILSAVGLLGFLDEISFGQRLFALEMPYIGSTEIDAAHDFFMLGYKVIRNLTHSQAIFSYGLIGLVAIMAAIAVLRYRHTLVGMISNGCYKQTYILTLFFVSLGLAALILDLEIIELDLMTWRALEASEELLEMNAALALLFCSLSLYNPEAIPKS